MEYNNSDKAVHGVEAQSGLEDLLIFCKERGLISDYTDNYRIGRPNYDDKQFYAPFLIVFVGDEKWALFSTTSMRTDRVKGQQWDAVNLKEINQDISKCYIVYPDSIKQMEIQAFENIGIKIKSKEIYSAIDGIVSQTKLYSLIEENATKSKTGGQIKDIQGKAFERRIAMVLSNSDNFEKWKTNDSKKVGVNYNMFADIVNFLKLISSEVEKIIATSDEKQIGLLPSRGKPKTDVIVDVHFTNGVRKLFTISCKRTSNQSVSVHQYKAETFSQVLDPKNVKLLELLLEFQTKGNLRDFGKEKEIELTKELAPYLDRLALWVFGGKYGDGNPTTQWADYFVTYKNDTDEYSIHTVRDYYSALKSQGVQGHFGTIFSWTYASKQRGKSIQLKTTII